jgi:hypothetical protein
MARVVAIKSNIHLPACCSREILRMRLPQGKKTVHHMQTTEEKKNKEFKILHKKIM